MRVIIYNALIRKPGFLYYVDKNGNVCETKANRKGGKKGRKFKKKILPLIIGQTVQKK